MKKIRIPAPGGELVLTFQEAADLAKRLTDAVQENSRPSEGLYLSRFDIQLILAKQYNRISVRNSRAGRLFSAMVRATAGGFIDFDMVCSRCGQTINSWSENPACSHFEVNERPFANTMELSAISIVKYADAFCDPASEIRGVGDTVRTDMRLLVSELTN